MLLNEDEVEVEAPGHGERQGHGITRAGKLLSDLADGVLTERENLGNTERENLEGMKIARSTDLEKRGAWVHRDGAGRQRRWPEHRLEQESRSAQKWNLVPGRGWRSRTGLRSDVADQDEFMKSRASALQLAAAAAAAAWRSFLPCGGRWWSQRLDAPNFVTCCLWGCGH
mmetsp:Transcript_13492/g.36201  ORF Transcript_13492/g.36201 Transcript_13492/m.36201 type:complete len:170 (+) Transcript_13492:567-1076(+)